MAPEGMPVASALDGQAGGIGWKLPLPPLAAYSMPEPHSPGMNDFQRYGKTSRGQAIIGYGQPPMAAWEDSRTFIHNARMPPLYVHQARTQRLIGWKPQQG